MIHDHALSVGNVDLSEGLVSAEEDAYADSKSATVVDPSRDLGIVVGVTAVRVLECESCFVKFFVCSAQAIAAESVSSCCICGLCWNRLCHTASLMSAVMSKPISSELFSSMGTQEEGMRREIDFHLESCMVRISSVEVWVLLFASTVSLVVVLAGLVSPEERAASNIAQGAIFGWALGTWVHQRLRHRALRQYLRFLRKLDESEAEPPKPRGFSAVTPTLFSQKSEHPT